MNSFAARLLAAFLLILSVGQAAYAAAPAPVTAWAQSADRGTPLSVTAPEAVSPAAAHGVATPAAPSADHVSSAAPDSRAFDLGRDAWKLRPPGQIAHAGGDADPRLQLAQLVLTGAGAGQGFHGGGAAFSTPGVVFGGYVGWRIGVGAGLGAADTTNGLVCFDAKFLIGTAGQSAASYAASTSQTANLRDWITNGGVTGGNSEAAKGYNIGTDNNVVGRGVLNKNDSGSAGTTNTNHSIQATYDNWRSISGQWVTICDAWDGTTPTTGGKQAVYVQFPGQAAVKLSSGYTKFTTGVIASPPLIVNLSNNTLGFGIAANAGNSPFSSFGHMEIGRVWVDNSSQTSGILDASSNLSGGLLSAIFGATGPKDWGSDGSLVLGSKPLIYSAGNAAARATNLGLSAATITYAAPTTTFADATPTSSNSIPLQDDFDGPADNNGLAKIKWGGVWTSLIAGDLSNTLGDTGFSARWQNGAGIALGDHLLIPWAVVDSTQNDDRSTGGAMACPAGWTAVGSPVHTFLNSDGSTVASCTRTADASDVTSAGADWVKGAGGDGNGGPPTFHFATNCSTACWATPKSVGYSIIDLGSATIDVFSGWVAQSKALTIAIPNITPGISNATLLTFGIPWNGSNGMAQPPTGYNNYRPGAITGSNSGLKIDWKYLNSNAAVTGQTFTQVAAGVSLFTASLTLHP